MIALMIQVVLSAWLGLVIAVWHPFHISICEVEHNPESQSLQITSRIFQDDFEAALDKLSQSVGFFSQHSQQEATEKLQQYFNQHLKILINDKPVNHNLLGFELEDNVVWSYLEIKGVNNLDKISITYSVLIDTFNDQINLAHIRHAGKVKSLKFQKNQLSGTAAFTN